MTWFKDWFNTSYYHLLYGERDEREASAFIRTLLSFLQPAREDVFLDLACGKGRHALDIAAQSYQVYGVDLSCESIEKARLNTNSNLHFDLHDMRQSYKCNHFNYILNLFTSFGYFDDPQDNLHTLNAVVTDLKPGGIFVQDYFNAVLVKENIVPIEIKQVAGIEFKIQKKLENNCIIKSISFSDQGQDFHYSEQVNLFDLADFEAMYASAGLQITNLFGDYQLSPFNEKLSERLILISRKIDEIN